MELERATKLAAELWAEKRRLEEKKRDQEEENTLRRLDERLAELRREHQAALALGYMQVEEEIQRAHMQELLERYRADLEVVRLATLTKQFAMEQVMGIARAVSWRIDWLGGREALFRQFTVELMGLKPPAGWRIGWMRSEEPTTDSATATDPALGTTTHEAQTYLYGVQGQEFQRRGVMNAEVQVAGDEEGDDDEQDDYQGDEHWEETATDQEVQTDDLPVEMRGDQHTQTEDSEIAALFVVDDWMEDLYL